MNNQQILQEKIRKFIKKYYLNELYKGIVFFTVILLSTFIVFSLFEYFSYSDRIIRSILFYSFILLFAGNLVFYIMIPVFKLCGIGKQITEEQIAKIIGKHFSQIDDKLLNLFELQKQLNRGDYESLELLSAAIDDKIDSFKAYSFVQAIPVSQTKKIARWTLVPIAVFILFFSVKSEVFTESTKRIVHHTTIYEKPSPYSFQITNPGLTAYQYDDFTINVKVKGSELPENVYVNYDNRNFKCNKVSNSEFSYTFQNLQKNIEFQITTEEVQSSLYQLNVLPKPNVTGFVMELHYPTYLHKNDDIIKNVSNVTVPEGTVINWKFYTKNSDNLVFAINGDSKEYTTEDNSCNIHILAKNSFTYSIFGKNKYMTSNDTLTDEVTVIKDMYPEISVLSQQDSIYSDRFYFKGNIKDDYGFSKLHFVYTKYDENGTIVEEDNVVDISIKNDITIQDFYFYFDIASFILKPGYKIDYYFEVFDNDGVNGPKSTKSSVSSYRVKTLEEIENELRKGDEQTKNDYEDLVAESSQLMKNIDKLQAQMMQEKEMSWQDKKKLEKLMEQYQQLKSKIEELKQNQQNKNSLENQYKEIDAGVLQKQQELQQRMDRVLTDEMKSMLQKLQEMMKSPTKDQVQKEMQKLKTNTDAINKTLDQQLQLYKQLELEKKVTDAVKQLNELSAELKTNAEKTNDKTTDKQYLQEKQQKIEKRYKEIQKDIQELKQLNNELEEPTDFKNTDELQQEIQQKMEQGKMNLEKNNRTKSSQNQKQASEDMEQLAQQLEKDFNESELEQVSEDIETLRQILDNLVKISFEQENVLETTKKTSSRSATVSDLMLKQHKVKDNLLVIEDSLNALARRQMAVKPYVQTEITKIRDYLTSSQNMLQDRRLSETSKNQQFVLTSMNNLALMLKESMKEMKKKQNECKGKCNKSGGSCSKPGGKGKSKKTSARELQQQLNRQMQALKKSMEQQGKQGQSQKSQQSMSEQFAKMAAQQEAIRKMLEDYENTLKSENGVGDKSIEQLINEMKQTEKELVNRKLTQQTIDRQNSITTRLLKSEKADIEREKDDERKSIEAKQQLRSNPPKEWKEDSKKTQQNEMLHSIPANLNYYYKKKANNYFYNID